MSTAQRADEALPAGRLAVRRSASDKAALPKDEMAQLDEYNLATCKDLGTVVPTPEERGYLPNY